LVVVADIRDACQRSRRLRSEHFSRVTRPPPIREPSRSVPRYEASTGEPQKQRARSAVSPPWECTSRYLPG